MKKSARYIADVIINIVIVASTVLAIVLYFFSGPDNLGSQGVDCFKYFTTDSNVVAFVASLLYIIFRLKGNVPKWVRVFKFVGTVAVTLTFLTVVFFLVPTSAIFGGGGLRVALFFFKGNVFVLHFSTPVLSIISTCFLEKDFPITKKQALWGLVPTAVYAAVYAIMVIVVKRWYDWYGFTFGGRFELAPVAIIGMLLVTLAIALVERLIRNKKR
ncbi:MAG: hypothetical protein MJ086_03965 [Lachnospiraceae bacterium]|nr:hypothetical protein [Lachnospiraceae bacterium]